MTDVVEIPLRRVDGSVRVVAIIDADMADEIDQYRWHYNPRGYACRTQRVGPRHLNGKLHIWMHRVIAGLDVDDPRQVDHMNRNTLDNRRANLRPVTHAHNARNQAGRAGTSQYRGVFWDTRAGKWRAQARLNYRSIHVGFYVDEHEAAAAVLRFWDEHPVEIAAAA